MIDKTAGGMYDHSQWSRNEEERTPLKNSPDSIRHKLFSCSIRWNQGEAATMAIGLTLGLFAFIISLADSAMECDGDYRNTTSVPTNSTEICTYNQGLFHKFVKISEPAFVFAGLLMIITSLCFRRINDNKVQHVELNERVDHPSVCNNCKQSVDPNTGMRSVQGITTSARSVFDSPLNSLDTSSHASSPKRAEINKTNEANGLEIKDPTTYLNAYCATFHEQYCQAYRIAFLTRQMNRDNATAYALEMATTPAKSAALSAKDRGTIQEPIRAFSLGTSNDEEALKQKLPVKYVVEYLQAYQKKFCQELGDLYHMQGEELGKEVEQFVQVVATNYAEIVAVAELKNLTGYLEDRSVCDLGEEHLL